MILKTPDRQFLLTVFVCFMEKSMNENTYELTEQYSKKYKEMILRLFCLACVCFCNDSRAAYPNITDENFRERVSIWEDDNYRFYVPEHDDWWVACTQEAKRGNNLIFDGCKLSKFTPKFPLEIKHYEISFHSARPIKKEWLDIVIHEFLNQEKLSYFTVYYTQSSIYNLEQDETKQDYKNCKNKTHEKSDKCVHTLFVRLLAYNDLEALRNGVIYNVGHDDGGLFMFYNIYTSQVPIQYETKSSLFIEDYTNQAWEVAQPVSPYKRNNKIHYDIEYYSKSILASDYLKHTTNFSTEFDRCKKRFIEENNGRFSEQNECYCNCVQNNVNNTVKKLDNPNKLALDIIETSYNHCDWQNSTLVNHLNQELEELLHKTTPLSKYDNCRLELYIQYATAPLGKTSVNICNAPNIISNITQCGSYLFN